MWLLIPLHPRAMCSKSTRGQGVGKLSRQIKLMLFQPSPSTTCMRECMLAAYCANCLRTVFLLPLPPSCLPRRSWLPSRSCQGRTLRRIVWGGLAVSNLLAVSLSRWDSRGTLSSITVRLSSITECKNAFTTRFSHLVGGSCLPYCNCITQSASLLPLSQPISPLLSLSSTRTQFYEQGWFGGLAEG